MGAKMKLKFVEQITLTQYRNPSAFKKYAPNAHAIFVHRWLVYKDKLSLLKYEFIKLFRKEKLFELQYDTETVDYKPKTEPTLRGETLRKHLEDLNIESTVYVENMVTVGQDPNTKEIVNVGHMVLKFANRDDAIRFKLSVM